MTGQTLQSLKKYIQSLLVDSGREASRLGRPTLYLVRLVSHIAIKLNETQCLQRASALAYTTILSLVPVTALFVLYFKVAGKLDTFNTTFQGWILKTFVAESAQGVAIYLDQFVANLHTRTLGTLGAGGLLFTAYSLLRTVEKSFNDIWRVRTHRSFWARFQILSTLLIVVPTALIASFYLSGKVQELKFIHTYADVSTLMRTVFVTVPFFLTAVSIFVLLKLVPNTTVRWKPTLVAALLSALLLELAKGGFNLYVIKVIPVSKIYGSLGLIPVFLLWIYFSWVIVLFGVEISYVIQNFGSLQKERAQAYMANPLSIAVHEEWGLRIFRALASRFTRGEGPQTAETLAKDLNLPIASVDDHLEIFQQAGLLTVAFADDLERAFVFARPLETIAEHDVIAPIRKQLGLPVEPKSEGHQKIF